MKNRVTLLIFTGLLLIGGYFSFSINTGDAYDEYRHLWEYRILHPEILPDTDIISLTSAGNTTSYADTLWIQLIQYIGDNIVGEAYNSFLNPVIEKINILHPHFTEPYNIALLLSPNLNPEKSNYETRKEITLAALQIGEMGIKNNCNSLQIEEIFSLEFSSKLFDNPRLKNPCSDTMLAYNVAVTANEVGEYDRAQKYFKVASVQDGAPLAARFLGPLMDAKLGDNKSAAERFLLIAIDAYDEPPYSCRIEAGNILKRYKTEPLSAFVNDLRPRINTIKKPISGDNPLAFGDNNCYGFLTRAIKQFYLGYVTEIANDFPEITTGSGLLEKGLLLTIPTIDEQDGWTLVKKNGKWTYRE